MANRTQTKIFSTYAVDRDSLSKVATEFVTAILSVEEAYLLSLSNVMKSEIKLIA